MNNHERSMALEMTGNNDSESGPLQNVDEKILKGKEIAPRLEYEGLPLRVAERIEEELRIFENSLSFDPSKTNSNPEAQKMIKDAVDRERIKLAEEARISTGIKSKFDN